MTCLIQISKDNYAGETARGTHEHIKDHNGKDHNLHMLKHNIEKNHENVNQEKFKIIAKNFKGNKWKGKLSESLWIKDLHTIETV